MLTIENIIPALRMILSTTELLSLRVIEKQNIRNNNVKFDLSLKSDDEEKTLFLVKKWMEDNAEIHPQYIIEIENIGAVIAAKNIHECNKLEATITGQKTLSKQASTPSSNKVQRAENKTIIITGAAQGFGQGIAECLIKEGANIVVADLNEIAGNATVKQLNEQCINNKALFVKTDVSNLDSIQYLILQTIVHFGGIDCFISNAGVLRAGSLEEMTPEQFEFVTKINYNAYFYCTKAISKIMKTQTKWASPWYYTDIIQINSKSGLRGSKANFAYAGGKFGGIGLTQSFALELAPYRIKVNAICPGNFYDGPLWSDPKNGLFVQYLNAGKVPGATTTEQVRDYYLSQAPMHKGCTPTDVTKGVLYLIDQCGETGQALPITGGQVMLS